jgi:hypothetical protein
MSRHPSNIRCLSQTQCPISSYCSENPGSAWGPGDVKPCEVIFVKTDFLKLFFETRHKQINATYILLTSNRCADAGIDAGCAGWRQLQLSG